MKKLLFCLSLGAVLTGLSDDSYLYWMVGDDVSLTYDAVKVAAVGSSWGVNYLTLATENFAELGETVSKTQIDAANDWDAGFLANLGAYASDAYTFYVELWNDNSAVAFTTAGMSWETAQAYLASRNAMTPGSTSSWSTPASGFTAGAIPEPTSGILMLFGFAALALRRRCA